MDTWSEFIKAFRGPDVPRETPWDALFGPLRCGAVDGMVTVGQIGQSLDGRIATATGHSHYINGPEGLAHLHRLRALADAVVVGIGTALADDPQLTVRRVEGAHPARVVIDPRGRLPASARLFAADGVRRIVLSATKRNIAIPSEVEWIELPLTAGLFSPEAILAALWERGLRRVLIEGGANTVSRFLAEGCLDRLHVVVAPLILGSGPTGLKLPEIARVDDALRPPVHTYPLGEEILFDCDLSGQRRAFGWAKKST